jgi:amino-acid N-acetyltransferase
MTSGTKSPVYSPAHAGLRSSVLALLGQCGLPTEDASATLENFFVARVDDDLIGVGGIDMMGELALFRSLAVTPAWRGRGVAHQLWELARGRARELAARELFLLTTTAEALFTRWGFARVSRDHAPAPVRETEEFKTLCADSAALMRLVL